MEPAPRRVRRWGPLVTPLDARPRWCPTRTQCVLSRHSGDAAGLSSLPPLSACCQRGRVTLSSEGREGSQLRGPLVPLRGGGGVRVPTGPPPPGLCLLREIRRFSRRHFFCLVFTIREIVPGALQVYSSEFLEFTCSFGSVSFPSGGWNTSSTLSPGIGTASCGCRTLSQKDGSSLSIWTPLLPRVFLDSRTTIRGWELLALCRRSPDFPGMPLSEIPFFWHPRL